MINTVKAGLLIPLLVYSFLCYSLDFASLERAIADGDHATIDAMFNEALETGDYKENLSYFSMLYGRLSPDPQDSAGVLAKMQAMNVLMQASRNDYEIDSGILEDGYRYALANLKYDHGTVSRVAIQIVSIYDRPDGFDVLLELAESQDSRTFRSAVSGAAEMCTSFSEQVFANFLDSLPEERRLEAVELRENFLTFDQSSGWCARSSKAN